MIERETWWQSTAGGGGWEAPADRLHVSRIGRFSPGGCANALWMPMVFCGIFAVFSGLGSRCIARWDVQPGISWHIEKVWRRSELIARTIATTLVALSLWDQPLTAQQIRARVVDHASRAPLADVTVTLVGPDSAVQQRTGTDANGFFLLRPRAAGPYEIIVERIGYAPERRGVTFEAKDLTLPAFVLRAEAIPVDSVVAIAERRSDQPVGFKRSSHVLSGIRMATLERHGTTLVSAIKEVGIGVRVREYLNANGIPVLCIESTRRIASLQRRTRECDFIALVYDGILLENPEKTLRGIFVRDLESIEYLTPVEAGYQYGLEASAKGAIVIWTRGRGPHRDPARDNK